MSVTDKALALAASFVPVFPLKLFGEGEKNPCTPRGHLDASILPDAVERLFADPAASGIGVPTGAGAGFSVVDIDPRHNGTAWYLENKHRLPATRTHRTKRDGFHLLFKHRDGVRNSAGKLAEGVDIRGEGGFIVWWPAAGVPIEDTSDIAEMPEWLFEEIITKTAPKVLDKPTCATPESWDDDAVRAALRGIERRLSDAAEGEKHATLCREAVLTGGILYATDMNEDSAAAWLVGCLPPVANEDLAISTALSGINKGQQHPIAMLGAAADFAAAPLPPEDPADLPPAKPRLRLLTLLDVEAQPDPTWLIDGLLPERSLAVVCGPAKSFKTFLVLSMALHIAADRPWSGRDVLGGGVVYVCGEGAGGLKLRIPAARSKFGIPANIPFWVLPAAVPLNNTAAVDGLVKLIRDAAGETAIKLVVIDTLARAMPGVDENSAGEVGRVVAACDRMKEALNCTVLPVHHTGKDKDRGMRGSSALDGAVDALLSVSRDKNVPGANVVQLSTVYQKEGEEAEPLFFTLESFGPAGGRSSLVPVLREGAQPSAAEQLTPQQQAALDVLKETIADADDADENAWRAACVGGRSVSASDTEKVRKQAFKAAFEALVRKRVVTSNAGRVRIAAAVRIVAAVSETELAALLGLGPSPD